MIVYIDNLNLGTSTTYNPVTRENSGGDARKYDNCNSAIMYLSSVAGPHTIVIRSGLYNSVNDYLIIDDSDFSNLTINCDDNVIINPSSLNEALQIGLTPTGIITVNKGEWKSSVGDEALYSNGAHTIFNGCIFTQANGCTSHCINVTAGTKIFNRCILRTRYVSNSYNGINSGGSVNITMNECIWQKAADAQVGAYIQGLFTSTGTQTINHCVVLDAHTHGVASGAGDTLTANNNIIQAGFMSPSGLALSRGTGILNAYNNYLISNLNNGDAGYSDILSIDSKNIRTNINPLLKSVQGGMILPQIDDTGSLNYAIDVETVLNNYNFKGTWFTNTTTWNSVNNSTVRDLLNRGVLEIGCHTTTHSDMSLSGTIFTVTKNSETITIDFDAETITLSGGGTIFNYKIKTLAEIKLELEGLGATVTPESIYNTGSATPGTIKFNCLGEVILDGQDINTIDILIDPSGGEGYYRAEMGVCKEYIEQNIIGDIIDPQTNNNYICRSLGYPFNNGNADSMDASLNIGFTSGRFNNNIEIYSKTAINLYSIWCGSNTLLLGDGTESSVRQNARAIAFAVVSAGLVLPILAHNTTELTIEQWNWACEEWYNYPGLIVTSQQLAVDTLKSIMSDNGYGYLTRTQDTFINGDIEHVSPCINKGLFITDVNTLGESDKNGFYIYNLPNIGLDQGAGTPGSDIIKFNIRPYSPK